MTQTRTDRRSGVSTGKAHVNTPADVTQEAALPLPTPDQKSLERRFQSTFENAAVGMAHVAPDGSFLRVNRRLCDITGYTASELLSRTFMDITHPDDLDTDVTLARRLAKGDIPDYSIEKRYVHKHGADIWVRLTCSSSRDDDGNLEFFISVVEDISELKAARERETEFLVKSTSADTAMATVNAMGEGVAVCDQDGCIQDVNPAFVEMTHRAADTLKGKNIRQILPSIFEETKQEIRQKLAQNRLRMTKRPEDALTLTDCDENPQWVIPSLTVMRGADAKEIGYVLTIRDVSPLIRSRQKLHEREQRYRQLVENANSIIMQITPQHEISFLNEYAQSFFGYRPEEIIGKNVIGTITPEHDSHERDLHDLVDQIIAQPELFGSVETENMRKDGQRVWVHWTNRALRDNQGQVQEVLCVGNDITERKKLEHEATAYRRRLQALTERLASTETQERKRIATHIHDTVVQSMALANIHLGGVLAMLKKEGLTDMHNEVSNTRAILEQGTQECRNLMGQLLPALLYEVGLLPALRDFAAKQTSTQGVPIEVTGDNAPTSINDAQRVLLFQCARELIMNALKHAAPKSIHIHLSSDDGHVHLQVRDTGCGFDPTTLHTTSHNHTDSGFGLFNIRERLDAQGGTLHIKSSRGKGTTATIGLLVAP